MTGFDEALRDPGTTGLLAAEERLSRFEIQFDSAAAGRAVERAMGVLRQRLDEQGSDLYVVHPAAEIYTECVAVGASMRAINGEPELSDRDLNAALENFEFLLNSLFHWACQF